MYEQIRNELISNLSGKVDMMTLPRIMSVLDNTLGRYDFTEKVTDMVPYEYSDPDCLKMYLACKNMEGVSPLTLKNKYYCIRKFLSTVNKPIHIITTNDIRLYLNYYKNTFATDDEGRDKIRQRLNAFFKWCYVEGYIDSNPCERVYHIKYEKKERQALSVSEMERLLYHCRTLFDKALLEMLYSTGARVSEICNAKLSDIDFEKGRVLLMCKGKKQHYGLLTAECILYLKKYICKRTDDEPWIFVRKYSDAYRNGFGHNGNIPEYGKLNKEYVERRLHHIADLAGIEKPCTPHVIRHTTGTVMIDKGAPLEIIQAVLGHSNIQTTQIYAKHDPEDIVREHRRCLG